MSQMGQKWTLHSIRSMSALPPKADMDQHGRDVRFVPKADLTRHAETYLGAAPLGTAWVRCH
jgi:hypothetical protein